MQFSYLLQNIIHEATYPSQFWFSKIAVIEKHIVSNTIKRKKTIQRDLNGYNKRNKPTRQMHKQNRGGCGGGKQMSG